MKVRRFIVCRVTADSCREQASRTLSRLAALNPTTYDLAISR